MFERFARSWQLTKTSFGVLRSDKQLVLFPILSTISCILISATFIVPAIFAVDWHQVFSHKSGPREHLPMQVWWYPLLFLFYFVNYAIIAFFNAALIACALRKFDGQSATLKDGLSAASKRMPQILAWSALNATVGVLLQMLQERLGWLGKWIVGLLGVGWNIATFFVVPVLVVEGVGPIDAVKRSAQVIRKTWGESLITQVGFGSAMALISVAVVGLPMVLGVVGTIMTDSAWPVLTGIGLGLVLGVIMALITTTMKTILVAATYRYAATGQVAPGFEGATLGGMFKSK